VSDSRTQAFPRVRRGVDQIQHCFDNVIVDLAHVEVEQESVRMSDLCNGLWTVVSCEIERYICDFPSVILGEILVVCATRLAQSKNFTPLVLLLSDPETKPSQFSEVINQGSAAKRKPFVCRLIILVCETGKGKMLGDKRFDLMAWEIAASLLCSQWHNDGRFLLDGGAGLDMIDGERISRDRNGT